MKSLKSNFSKVNFFTLGYVASVLVIVFYVKLTLKEKIIDICWLISFTFMHLRILSLHLMSIKRIPLKRLKYLFNKFLVKVVLLNSQIKPKKGTLLRVYGGKWFPGSNKPL